MKHLTRNLALSFLALVTLSTSAFAMDQITLSNGQTIECKVLNDVPNMYVDIELPNVTKQRYQHRDVSSVDRDVPSNTRESSTYGNESIGYIGGLVGFSLYNSNGSSFTQLDYGARVGFNVTQMGNFGKLALGVHFDRFSVNSDTSNTLNVSVPYTVILGQIAFRKIANSGFYFGGEAGLGLVSLQQTLNGVTSSTTANIFVGGGFTGYEIFLTPSFSIGPEVHFDAMSGPTYNNVTYASTNVFKFLGNVSVHF